MMRHASMITYNEKRVVKGKNETEEKRNMCGANERTNTSFSLCQRTIRGVNQFT